MRGRTASPIPTEHVHVKFPGPLKQRVELVLYSEVEQCVPRGRWSDFLVEATREKLDWPALSLEPYGFPPGFFVKGPPAMVRALRLQLEKTSVHT